MPRVELKEVDRNGNEKDASRRPDSNVRRVGLMYMRMEIGKENPGQLIKKHSSRFDSKGVEAWGWVE
jgi:hypothetical protein